MQISEIILAVLLTAIAVSYGWGMRGTIIGGEKGAMLPGALLGLFLAKLSGIPVISENAFIFSAVGCLSMGYGGFETYAQTMEMVIHHKSDIFNPKRGYIGLMLKGGNWFGICGAILGMSFTAMSGVFYKWYEIAILILLIPFIQILGIKIFNTPYDKKKCVFPKIYFSRNRREEWGGNTLTLLTILIITAVKGDWYAFFFGITGIISGAVGWAVAIWLYDITVHPLKNGKYVFGKLQKDGYIDNWKIMELTLGLLGGAGLAIYFFLRLDYVEKISADGFWNILKKNDSTVAWVCFGLTIALIVQYFSKKFSSSRFIELAERAVYYSLLLTFVLLGSNKMSEIVVFLLILWVLTEKNIFDRLGKTKSETTLKITYATIFILALIGEIFFKISCSVPLTVAMYTFFYLFSEVIFIAITPSSTPEKAFMDKFEGRILTCIWFLIMSIFLTNISFKIL